jgi:hypothetical protein
MPAQKTPKNVIILSFIVGEVVAYAVNLSLFGIAIYILTSQFLVLPTFLSGTIFYLFSLVRADPVNVYRKKLGENEVGTKNQAV